MSWFEASCKFLYLIDVQFMPLSTVAGFWRSTLSWKDLKALTKKSKEKSWSRPCFEWKFWATILVEKGCNAIWIFFLPFWGVSLKLKGLIYIPYMDNTMKWNPNKLKEDIGLTRASARALSASRLCLRILSVRWGVAGGRRLPTPPRFAP